MSQVHIEEHDRGLHHDLATISSQVMARRRALGFLASAGGAALVAGCGGGSGSDSSDSAASTGSSSVSSSASTSSSSSSSTASSSSSSASSTSSASGTCIADPSETAGPYPADGTNNASGSTSNVLTASGIVRSDIRPSFIGSTTVAPGVQVTFTITVVNANAACAPLAGYAVYLWHCNRDGSYSLYDVPTESYLRGVQVTDANGQVTFTTIYPACYSGRYPHMHFEIFTSLAVATGGRAAKLTSQFAMPASVCSVVYSSATGYSTSQSRFTGVSTSTDNVFGDNTAAQIAQQTPTFTGSVASGYTALAVVGVAV